jgi:membrane protease YdiL (CAAX protease family)
MEMVTIERSRPYFRGLEEGTVLAMLDIGSPEVRLAFVKMVLLCLLWSMIVAWVWLIWRVVSGQPILPERPLVERRETPWRAGTVFLVALAYMLVAVGIMRGYPLVAALLPGGPALPVANDFGTTNKPVVTAAPPPAPAPKVGSGVADRPAQGAAIDDEKTPLSHQMLLNGLMDLFMLIVVPVVARFTCGSRLRDFGLSFDGWWRQAAIGVVATMIVTPAVSAIQFAATKIWSPQAHPFQEMMFKEFTVGMAGVAVMTAVVVAPLFEELAFRGLLQSWLVDALLRSAGRKPSNGVVVDVPSDEPANPVLATSDWQREPEAEPASPYESPKALDSPGPLPVPDANPLGYAWLGVLLTSLLFASVHFAQWPAPVALFALALVIGTVYQRTGSLIAAVAMHATFNGLNTLLLFLVLLSGHKLEADKVSGQGACEQITPVKIGKAQHLPTMADRQS